MLPPWGMDSIFILGPPIPASGQPLLGAALSSDCSVGAAPLTPCPDSDYLQRTRGVYMNDLPAIDLTTGVGLILVFTAVILWIVLTVLWIILPFAVFGIKKRLDIMNSLLREVGMLLDSRLPPPGRRAGEDIRIHPERDEDSFSGRHF